MKKRMVCGWMAAALAAWTLHAAAAQPKLTGIEFQSSPAGVTVSGQGEAGTAYTLQWSERLGTQENWQEASEATAKADGTFTALDQTFCKPGFYRVEREGGAGGHKGIQLWEGGPYWAETNIGAEKAEDYGLYFWWGDNIGYKWENDAWVSSDGARNHCSFGGRTNALTLYKDHAELRLEGWITAENILAPAHDAAHVHWGGGWRMPTDADLKSIVTNCDWTWMTTNNVNGYLVRGRGAYETKSIFLPASGLGINSWLSDVGSQGYYWGSVPVAFIIPGDVQQWYEKAWHIYFYDTPVDDVLYHTGWWPRDYGMPVRPVWDTAE